VRPAAAGEGSPLNRGERSALLDRCRQILITEGGGEKGYQSAVPSREEGNRNIGAPTRPFDHGRERKLPYVNRL